MWQQGCGTFKMNLFTISFRNLQRRPFRAAIFSVVFATGLAAVAGLHYVSKDIGHSIDEKLSRFGANIVIMPQDSSHSVSYGGVQLGSLSYVIPYLNESSIINAVRSIESNQNISAVAPKLIVTGEYNGESILIAGVDWEQELFMNFAWNITEEDIKAPVYTAAGYGVAQRLGISAGTDIYIDKTALKVEHVLAENGDDSDNLIFTTLSGLQYITGNADKVNFVEVAALCSACPIEDIVSQISANTDAQVKALQSVVKQSMYTIDFVETLLWCVILVILTASILMMALFMLSSVNERKKEIGIMRAIGYSKPSIFAAICAEAAILAIFSGIAGYIAGYLAGIKVLTVMDIAVMHEKIPFGDAFITIGVALIIAIIASAAPALKAAGLDPAEALSRL